METIQELADEAFRDLLKKHRRPTTLKEMLRELARPTTTSPYASFGPELGSARAHPSASISARSTT
jgi:hypothetical protein